MRRWLAPLVVSLVACTGSPAGGERSGSVRTQPLLGPRSVVVATAQEFARGVGDRDGVEFGTSVVRGPLRAGLGVSSAGPSLPSARRRAAVASLGADLYLFGGCTSVDNNNTCQAFTAEVLKATVLPSGTLTPWTSQTPLPSAREGSAAVWWNDHVLVTGGRGAGGVLGEVLTAPVLTDGTLGPWTTTPLAAAARTEHAAVVSRGTLYLLAGRSAGGPQLGEISAGPLGPAAELGTFISISALPGPISNFCAVATGGALHVIGGFVTGPRPETWSAQVMDSGLLGAWQSTTTLPDGTADEGCAAAGGHLYVLGGSELSSGNQSKVLRVAPIIGRGLLGPWTISTALATPLEGTSLAQVPGAIVVAGGKTGPATTLTAGTWLLPIDDSALPTAGVGASGLTTPLPVALEHLVGLTAQGGVYAIGGCDAGPTGGPCVSMSATTFRAPLMGDGGLGSWAAVPSLLPTPRERSAGFAHGSALYVLGGNTGVRTADVLRAPVLPDGGLGAWATLGATFPPARGSVMASATASAVWIGGGGSSVSYQSDLQRAPLLADGGVGPFTVMGAFPIPRIEGQLWTDDQHVAVLGGWDGVGPLGDVRQATVLADGGLGPFSNGSLVGNTTVAGMVRYGGHLWLAGGFLKDVQVASVLPDGGLGRWLTRGGLAHPRERYAAIAADDHLFAVAGNDGVGFTAEVESLPLQVAVAHAVYERQFDLGPGVASLDGVVAQGAAASSQARLDYRTATEDSGFSAWAGAGPFTFGVQVPLDAGAVRFLQLRLLFDDPPSARQDALASVAPAIDSLTVNFIGDVGADGGVLVDGGLLDGGLLDGGLLDGGLPDGGLPDGGLPDGGLPDGGLPDGGLPDGGLPDGGLPDGGQPGPRVLAVGCDCQSASGVATGLIALTLARRRRRRSP